MDILYNYNNVFSKGAESAISCPTFNSFYFFEFSLSKYFSGQEMTLLTPFHFFGLLSVIVEPRGYYIYLLTILPFYYSKKK
jgi:hypothetical protein